MMYNIIKHDYNFLLNLSETYYHWGISGDRKSEHSWSFSQSRGLIRINFNNEDTSAKKIRKLVASTLLLSMMNGTAGSFLAGQFAIIAATSERVSTSNAEGGATDSTIEAGTYWFKAGKVFKLISARGVKNLNELFQEMANI